MCLNFSPFVVVFDLGSVSVLAYEQAQLMVNVHLIVFFVQKKCGINLPK